jgi:hypothetical protein
MGKTILPRDTDALLQASRRLDWRFLLPEPELGRVACVAVDEPNLVDSLRLFGREVTVLEAIQAREELAPQDVVVLRNPSRAELAAAATLLRPGGWLYVEVARPRGWRRPGRLNSVRGYARALRRLGLAEVEAHVHWPDFGSCGAIVPLNDAVAVRHALARKRRGGGVPFASRLAPLLAATGLLGAAVTSASAVGRRVGRAAEGAG